MITVLVYVVLRSQFGVDWSNWLMLLPVLLDLVIIDKVCRHA